MPKMLLEPAKYTERRKEKKHYENQNERENLYSSDYFYFDFDSDACGSVVLHAETEYSGRL